MPSKWETFPVEFKGGLISNMSPLQQGINAVGSATFLQNFEPSKEGGYKKILGYSKKVSTVVPGSGVVLGVRVVNQVQTIAVRSNGSRSQYYLDSGAGWVSLGTSSTGVGGKVRGINFNFDGNHKIIFVDGVNYPCVFNDTTNTLTNLSAPTDILAAKYVESFKNLIFLAKGTNLVFSAPYDETDYTVANGSGVINVGHTITGLKVFRDQLIIFTNNRIMRLVGSSFADFQLLPIAESIGCIAPDSIQEVGGDLLFLAPDGLRFLGATDRIGDFSLSIASSPIEQDALDFISNSSEFTSVVIRSKAQYRIFGYVESQENISSNGLIATKFMDQSSQGMQWAELKGMKAYVADSRYVETTEVILFAATDGYVYQMESGSSFDGESIEAIFESPFMPINDPEVRKTFYKLSLYVDLIGVFDATVTLRYDLNKVRNYTNIQPESITISSDNTGVAVYGGSGIVYGSATFGDELDQVYNTPIIGSGRTFSFRIKDDSTNPSFSLDTAIFEFTTNDRI